MRVTGRFQLFMDVWSEYSNCDESKAGGEGVMILERELRMDQQDAEGLSCFQLTVNVVPIFHSMIVQQTCRVTNLIPLHNSRLSF